MYCRADLDCEAGLSGVSGYFCESCKVLDVKNQPLKYNSVCVHTVTPEFVMQIDIIISVCSGLISKDDLPV